MHHGFLFAIERKFFKRLKMGYDNMMLDFTAIKKLYVVNTSICIPYYNSVIVDLDERSLKITLESTCPYFRMEKSNISALHKILHHG